MNLDAKCEYCHKDFKKRDEQQIGRFCSEICNRKILRKDQLEKYKKYLENETEEQKLEWLKRHYEKFVVKKENGCWQWNGHKQFGYGKFNHRRKIISAHRAAWIIYKGKIPEGLFVLHTCDVRSCSNPQHLFLGNQYDNMKDMASKRRTKITCKLTDHKVIEIKKLLDLGVSMVKIAKKYDVSSNAIWEIKHNKTWKHII